jgi:hypothetical protein
VSEYITMLFREKNSFNGDINQCSFARDSSAE